MIFRLLPVVKNLAKNIKESLNNDIKSPKGKITNDEIFSILKNLSNDIIKIVGESKVIK